MLPYSIIVLINFFLFKKSCGDGIVSIFLTHYDNPGGLKATGGCCDDWFCANTCDHYFTVCLDKLSGDQYDYSECHFGKYTTGTTDDTIAINFRSTIGSTPNPKELHFHRWPGSALLKVRVLDEDPNVSDFVELLTTTVNISASRSRAEKKFTSFVVKERTQLEFEMAAFCDKNWYGRHCDIHCEPFGNYRCNSDGRKHCVPGWTGENCTQSINSCVSTSCAKPGGKCVYNNGGYSCECLPGYTGTACEHEINECASNPCDNNAACVDKIDQFQCLCPKGYTGSKCKLETDKCASQPCNSNATCVNAIGKFQCICLTGYTGSTCETQIEDCDKNGTCYGSAERPGFTLKMVGIITAVSVLAIMTVVIISVIVRKIYQKRKKQIEHEAQVQAYQLGLDDIDPYSLYQPGHARPPTNDHASFDVSDERAENLHEGREGQPIVYLHPLKNEATNKYLEVLPDEPIHNDGKSSTVDDGRREVSENQPIVYLHPPKNVKANKYLEVLPAKPTTNDDPPSKVNDEKCEEIKTNTYLKLIPAEADVIPDN